MPRHLTPFLQLLMRTFMLSLTLCLVNIAEAQPQDDRTRGYAATSDIVVVAIASDETMSGARAIVIRRPTAPTNVVLVRRDAAAEDLALAMAAVIQARRTRGDLLSREERARIEPDRMRYTRPSRRALAAAARDLKLLRDAPNVSIPGLGDAQAIPLPVHIQLLRH